MRDILIATKNRGKFPEIAAGLRELPFTAMSALEVPELENFEPEETGATFEENAIIKAKAYGQKSGILTIADDSGLEIDALGGEPGVRTARYVPGSDKDRYMAVLEKMKDVPDGKRGAKFVSVIAVYDPKTKKVATTRGECVGHIAQEPKGDRGYGYDPIFYVDEIRKTYAEATLGEKMSIDHRGKALKLIRDVLQKDFA